VAWQMFPPSLLIEDVATVQPEPIRFGRLVARPALNDLLHRRLRIAHLHVQDAVLPQLSLRALKVKPADPGAGTPQVLVDQLRFTNLTWITRYGTRLEFDGHARFDAGWRPAEVEITRPGVRPLTRLTLAREGDADRWKVGLALGGGTADGQIALLQDKQGKLQLTGQLAPRNLDVDSVLAAFKRHSAVDGKASGSTTLSASGEAVGELARSLHTRTEFTVAGATLLHIDVDKAIRSAGRDRAGQTTLLSLAGQMDTQNTPDGMVVTYSAIQAKGETFSARGEGTIANRHIDGALTVDLVGGLIGVPLKVSGPLAKPQVTVPASALAGAAVGTVVLPVIGTAIGASVGAAIGKLFGGDDRKENPVPKTPPR
ncbi:MAG: glycine zipper domain-containing protein, partial [Ramlibacter sp.]